MARTAFDFDAMLARARMVARSRNIVVYIVPTYYGLQLHYTAATLAVDKWVEVRPDDTAVAVESRMENDGRHITRTPIA